MRQLERGREFDANISNHLIGGRMVARPDPQNAPNRRPKEKQGRGSFLFSLLVSFRILPRSTARRASIRFPSRRGGSAQLRGFWASPRRPRSNEEGYPEEAEGH